MLIANSPVKLGDVHLNDTTVFDVDIHNSSNVDAKIVEIFVGCQSCTTVKMPKRLLHSNETVKLTANFTPKTLGEHNKTITLRYEAGQLQSKVIINFTANAVKV